MNLMSDNEARALHFDPVACARVFDVPPWIMSSVPEPRFSRLRWKLRRVFPRLVWGDAA